MNAKRARKISETGEMSTYFKAIKIAAERGWTECYISAGDRLVKGPYKKVLEDLGYEVGYLSEFSDTGKRWDNPTGRIRWNK